MKWYQWMIIGMGIAIAVLVSFKIGQKRPLTCDPTEIKTKTDTLFVRDTIVQIQPQIVERIKVEKVTLPADTVRINDTLYVELEKEHIMWRDSLCSVYASGIEPKVDSVVHYVSSQIVTIETEIPVAKAKRWGIGVQAGYGFGNGGLTPYVGIGLSYNLITF